MSGTIRKLFGVSGVFLLLAISASYFGYRQGAANGPAPANTLARQFAADPGDGLVMAGGLLMVIAMALACAGLMLWMRERKQ